MTRDSSASALALVLVVGAVAAFWVWRTISQQAETIRVLEKKASAASAVSDSHSTRAPDLALQQACADAARKWWATTGWTTKDLAGYENHYNARMNRCFVDYQSTTADKVSVLTDRQIMDVFENKTYGEFMTYNPGDKKYWELKPSKCEVRIGADLVKCDGEHQFSDLAKAYMEG